MSRKKPKAFAKGIVERKNLLPKPFLELRDTLIFILPMSTSNPEFDFVGRV